MKNPTLLRTSVAIAFALSTMAAAQANTLSTLSGYGFDVTYDASQLGSSWTAAFGATPTGSTTLLFQNSSSATVDYFNTSFSFSITPRHVTGVLGSNTYSWQEFTYNSTTGGDQLTGTWTQTSTTYFDYTGGAINSISSLGTNTLPANTSLASAVGENTLSATVATATGTRTKQNTITYLDATSGNNNTVFIQDAQQPSNLPALTSLFSNPTATFAAGSQFSAGGVIYEALVARDSSNLMNTLWNPIYANQPNSFWKTLPVPPAFGGVLDAPVDVTVSSEIWTPTFLQPGIHHCATVSCMVAANGQYVATAFEVDLGSTARNYVESTMVLTPVPEPETYAMLLAGLGLMGAIARRRKQNQG